MKQHYKALDFSTYSSLKVGPISEVYYIDEIGSYETFYIIGAANNLLVTENHPPLARLSKTFDYIRIDSDKLIVGAATPTGKVVSFCKKHNIGGFEFLSQLPGTIGGCVKMNAGLKQFELFNNLVSLNTVEGSRVKDDIVYGYRYTDISVPVFEVTFEFEGKFNGSLVEQFKTMRANQPKEPSAGSCFKNPPNDYAGRLIEEAGLKGKRLGGMAFSEVHANFLVNKGQGSVNEALELIALAKEKVFQKSGITLENEIIIL